MENKFSFYTTPLKSTNGHFHQPIKLVDFLNGIKNGEWKTQVEAVRNGAAKDKLPYVVLSATMADGKRENKAAIEHSGLLQIDIDGKDNPDKTAAEIKAMIQYDKHLFAVFISPSGTGVKGVANIPKNIDGHGAAFVDLEAYFLSEYGRKIDNKCKDISRPFFVSYDPEIIINVNAIVKELEPKKNDSIQTTTIQQATKLQLPNNTETEHEKRLRHIEVLCNRVESGGTDITSNYDNFLKIGFAINDGLGEAGREYYHRLCRFHPEYDHQKTDKQYTVCKTPGQTKWPTLLEIAKQNNIILFPTKSTFTTQSPTPKKLVASGVDNLASIPSPIKTVPPSKIIIEKPTQISDRERLENAITDKMETRRNTVKDMVECRTKNVEGAVWEQANEHNITRMLEKMFNKNFNPTKINSLLQSDYVEPFDPFWGYFNSLQPYNDRTEPDYIKQLSNIVKLRDENKDRLRFETQFKKALVRSVACSLPKAGVINNTNFNKHALIFISPDQGIGKSSFVRYMVPKGLLEFYPEKIELGGRDEDMTMASAFMINIDEMATIKDDNLNRIKQAMSQSTHNFRKMNTGKRFVGPRRCNFWGTTNETAILKDNTGSVRWLCFEVASFNKEKEYWKENSPLYVDMDKVWAQALFLFQNGFHFQLTQIEQEENEKANAFYKEPSLEEELMNSCFIKSEISKINHKQTFEIFAILKEKYPSATRELSLKKLGSYLTNSRLFIRGQEWNRLKGFNVWGYYVSQL